MLYHNDKSENKHNVNQSILYATLANFKQYKLTNYDKSTVNRTNLKKKKKTQERTDKYVAKLQL